MDRPSGPTYRGFLFADLRDYTAFVERHGDAAASALLDRCRALVRSAVAQYGGAEVKTEGDSFFVVFPSASSAVRCALEILQAAEVASRDDPATALRVGIGVHAGETVPGSEGYVGSAVNLAARVCAEARAGEVLVTDTVRALTRTSLDVGFTDGGLRRLKGIPEPVRLYSVSPAGIEGAATAATPRGASPGWAKGRYAVPVVIALALGVGGVAGASWLSARPPVTPRPLPSGSLSPGMYAAVQFQPPFTFSVGDGWADAVDTPDDFYLVRVASPRGAMGAFRTNVVFSGPCRNSPTQRIEGGSESLLTWLEQHPYLESVNPRPRVVDGITGIQIDVTARALPEPCPDGSRHVQLIPLAGTDGVSIGPNQKMRFVVADHPGGTVTFDLTAPTDLQQFLVEADAVLDTVDFVD